MASVAGVNFTAGFSFRRRAPVAAVFRPATSRVPAAVATERSVAESSPADLRAEKWTENSPEIAPTAAEKKKVLEEDGGEEMSLKDYFEEAKLMIRSHGGCGPPRWFSPVDCAVRMPNSPLLLYLPGIDGVGLGLISQQPKLGKIFDIWCLHIPVKDRTPFQELVRLVEETVRSEHLQCPHRPIYLVGESIGACLALAVAARNPDIDLVLILANPATSFNNSQLQSVLPLLELMPSELSLMSLPYMLNLISGEPLKTAFPNLEKGIELQRTPEQLFQGLGKLTSYISVLADILPGDTLLWKLQMMRSASSYANSRLHAVKAQVLVLASERDPLLPNLEEAERIRQSLPKQEIRVLKSVGKMPKCEVRKFEDCGHFLFLEDKVDLVTILKGTAYYRRGRVHDYVTDFLPPTVSEFKKICESTGFYSWIGAATDPVMFSTLDNGDIVRGLEGVPTDGPVLYVGYHMLMGLELYPLVTNFLTQKDILLRGLAHPILFVKLSEAQGDLSAFDTFKVMGAVPVTASNFYKLLATGSHVLLYPGGMREALHKRGEAYQLIWPERSEFVRMAARFGAKIVPFGLVGEDDICELVADFEDQMKIPYLRERIEVGRRDIIRVRSDMEGQEVANEVGYLPILLPKLPGRFYYLFGKPIETAGLKQELKNRDKAHEMYLHVKSEVEHCISYLKEKREKDPYRNIAARALYRATHGEKSEVPTFEI